MVVIELMLKHGAGEQSIIQIDHANILDTGTNKNKNWKQP